MINLKYNRAFDLEDVCDGDILISRQDKEKMLVVLYVDIDTEEWICAKLNEKAPIGRLSQLVTRIGFKRIDDYLMARVEEE